MKKVLSVAMASAMVLGMGANAFAISYSTGSNEKADWPENFQFDGSLFVTDKDGKLVEEATTELNDNETVDFEPGDVIWMPLYADDQVVYESTYEEGEDDLAEVTSVKVEAKDFVVTDTLNGWQVYQGTNGSYYSTNGSHAAAEALPDGYVYVADGGSYNDVNGVACKTYKAMKVVSANVPTTVKYDKEDRDVKENSVKYYVGASKVSEEDFLNAYLNGKNAYITVTLEEVEGTDDVASKPVNSGKIVDYGHYTGNIDKNWSINLIEKSTGVAELIAKAELYKATTTDVASYARYGADITTNSVFLKITLEDEWKTVDDETLKYYVYIANNNNKAQQTNEVWVSGTYANTDVREVSFDWTNDASKPGLWKVKEGNGVAVFDFADKAFFSVKMYEGETMYLDLKTAYDKAIAGEMDAEADSFYKFDNTNANFARTGELLIVSDDSSLVPYEIDADGNFVKVDAEYVENYAVAHTNQKVNGFVFNTKQLGNYVLSTEELGEEEEVAEEPTTEEPVVEEPAVEEPVVEETNKPNPNTGAEDFVGLAVSLAVVSVAAAGALALKK